MTYPFHIPNLPTNTVNVKHRDAFKYARVSESFIIQTI